MPHRRNAVRRSELSAKRRVGETPCGETPHRRSAVSAKRRAAKRRQRNAVSANCPVPLYAIRPARRDEQSIVKQRVAEALFRDPSRDFGAEIERMRGNQADTNRVVDGCTDHAGISELFADKYKSLYNSVLYDFNENAIHS